MPDRPAYVVASKTGSLIDVFVQPKAAKTELVGIHGRALKVKVRAVPEGGRANDAVCALLAGLLGVPPSTVTVVSGASSRHKRVAVSQVPPAAVAGAIGPLLGARKAP